MRVTFTLARNSELPEFERFFGCPVEFSASADQFTLSNETLAIPLVTEDHHLLETLRPICEEAAKERKTVHGTLRSLVENELHKLLHHGKADRQRVAKALGLGPVATCVGIGWRVFGRHEAIRSCGKVNDLIVWFLGEGLPSVDLAHGDLS